LFYIKTDIKVKKKELLEKSLSKKKKFLDFFIWLFGDTNMKPKVKLNKETLGENLEFISRGLQWLLV
jgi:hypothetical protein